MQVKPQQVEADVSSSSAHRSNPLLSLFNPSDAFNSCIVAQIYTKETMDTLDISKLADLLKALGEVNRLSLVCTLCDSKTAQNATCLCSCCSVDASGVSRHLKILSQQGIVSVEKRGRERNYSLNRAYVATRLRELADRIESNLETS